LGLFGIDGKYPKDGSYGSDGYYMDFAGGDPQEFKKKIKHLKDVNWID